MVGTYKSHLLFCECGWGGGCTRRWWGHLNTTHYNWTYLNFLDECKGTRCIRVWGVRACEGTKGVIGAKAQGCEGWNRVWGVRATWWNFQYLIFLLFQVSLERGENIIICIFMPNVKPEQLPATLRMITKTVTRLKWSPEINAQRIFWLLLQRGLIKGHAENPAMIIWGKTIVLVHH